MSVRHTPEPEKNIRLSSTTNAHGGQIEPENARGKLSGDHLMPQNAKGHADTSARGGTKEGFADRAILGKEGSRPNLSNPLK